MIMGLSTSTFTLLHVVISLAGLLTGAVTVGAMVTGRWRHRWNAWFLATTIATSVTGFLFHSAGFGPPQVIGTISLVVLAIALAALYLGRLEGRWRWIYAASAVVALYLNCFVAVVQAFQKMPLLSALAPTQSEPPFVAAQVLLMAAFILVGVFGVRRFHPTAAGKPFKSALVASRDA